MKSFSRPDPNPRLLLPLLLVAIAAPAVIPGAPGTVIALAAFSATLYLFVRARALRGWLVVALVAAAAVAAALG